MDPATHEVCEKIRREYSPCDVSDALLKLNIPSAGFLKDISPILSLHGSTNRIVAPISTVIFVPKTHEPGTPVPDLEVPESSNLPSNNHWTDVAPPGSVVLLQQPSDQIVALVGDIVATRYRLRGVKGVVVDGRVRDIVGCAQICAGGEFSVWSKALSSVGTSLEAKPWAVDVPIRVHDVVVRPGDLLVADEAEMVACVIPRDRLSEVLQLLVVQKVADDGVLRDIKSGLGFTAALANWPKHYSNH